MPLARTRRCDAVCALSDASSRRRRGLWTDRDGGPEDTQQASTVDARLNKQGQSTTTHPQHATHGCTAPRSAGPAAPPAAPAPSPQLPEDSNPAGDKPRLERRAGRRCATNPRLRGHDLRARRGDARRRHRGRADTRAAARRGRGTSSTIKADAVAVALTEKSHEPFSESHTITGRKTHGGRRFPNRHSESR